MILRSFVIALFVRTALARSPFTFFGLKLAAAGLATGPELLDALQNGLAAGLIEADDEGRFVLAADLATDPPGWYSRLAAHARGENRRTLRRILRHDHAHIRLAWLTFIAHRLRATRRQAALTIGAPSIPALRAEVLS